MPDPMERPLIARPWWREALQVLRFGIVGIAATATHYVIALLLATGGGAPAQIAHVTGFLAALPVSFFGHYHWTFRSRARVTRAAGRFAAVALGAFLASAMLLETLTRLTDWHVAASILFSVLLIPIASYILNRVFVF